MKNRIVITLVLFLMSTSIFAQDGRNREKMEQVKSLKIAYITNELALSSEEAAKFWPVYNDYEEKQRLVKRQKMGNYMDRMDTGAIDKMTEKEASAVLAQMESNEEELFQLRKKFVANLRNVIPPIKIIKLKKAEENFNRKLLKQYRDKNRK